MVISASKSSFKAVYNNSEVCSTLFFDTISYAYMCIHIHIYLFKALVLLRCLNRITTTMIMTAIVTISSSRDDSIPLTIAVVLSISEPMEQSLSGTVQ